MVRPACVVGVTLLSLSLFACAPKPPPKNYTWTTLPKAEGTLITTKAATENDAMSGARREAEEHCAKMQKSFIVVSGPETQYEGRDKTGAAGVANNALNKIFKSGDSTSQDWRAEMVINCQ